MANEPTERYWSDLGLSLVNRPSNDSDHSKRVFKSHYGCSAVVVMKCWSLIRSLTLISSVKGLKPCHLLWALLFLKAYQTEMVLSSTTKASEKCTRKWVWLIIEAIAALEDHVVSICLISM